MMNMSLTTFNCLEDDFFILSCQYLDMVVMTEMHLGYFHQGREGAHQWTQIESYYNDYFKHANELKTY